MFGGKSSLEPLREPIKEKFNGIINQLFDDEQVQILLIPLKIRLKN